MTRNGRPVYDSRRGGQPKPMRAKGCRGPVERPPKAGQEGGGQRIVRGGWGCPLAYPVRGRGTVAHAPLGTLEVAREVGLGGGAGPLV